MIVLIILLGIALALSFAFNLGLIGATKPNSRRMTSSNAASTSRSTVEERRDDAEQVRRSKEIEGLRTELAVDRDELKAAKRKLFEATQVGKEQDDLARARTSVERIASVQLDATRAELAVAQAEIARLKNAALRVPPLVERTPRTDVKPTPPPQRVIRELSDADRARIAQLEGQVSAERKRANHAESEGRSIKSRMERMDREFKRVYSESNLARDKFRAIEIRLNRHLLENDLLRRAIAQLERQTGAAADRQAPTIEELDLADLTVRNRHQEEDRVEAETRDRVAQQNLETHSDDAEAAGAS